TAADYLAFELMILNEGKSNGTAVLKPETVKAMTENQLGALDVRLLKTAVPGARSAGSLTWAGLGNTYFWIDPKKRVAGVILCQLIPFADAKVLALCG